MAARLLETVMALYAIGDIQGCKASLDRLLATVGFDRAVDRLWLVGDLVNRGPDSLGVLRWAVEHDDRITAVLGNHDLHLLGRVAGTAQKKKRDTLDAVLAAPDRDVLIDWLRRRPLVHVESDFVIVHAGLHPRWTAPEARVLAMEIETRLAGDDWKDLLAEVSGLGGESVQWAPELRGAARSRAIVAYLTRARMCQPDGTLDADFAGHPSEAPKGVVPWFRAPGRAWTAHVPVFGHWAALGLDLAPDHVALDSGCVWGNALTAIRLPDRAVTQVKTVDKLG
jgi:bis(5'-nucleosyl)-tetraphosphatase (symmetrical)